MADPITSIARWLEGLFMGWGLAPGLMTVILYVLGILIMATALLLLDIFLVWVERKVVARFQDRVGPNRLGPYGLIQPFADIVKLLIKEDITPEGADRILYNIPPVIALATVLLLWGVIPLAPTVLGAEINVGVLFIIAIGAISTLGIIIAGWASNNKYALMGAFRTVAQMVSYEVPMGIALLVPVLLARSMGVGEMVARQTTWFVFLAPVAAILFLIASIAEIGRAPFDLPEAESEIVAGFHIEYTGMKFGMFYAGELLHALTVGALFATFFLGGWRGPFAEQFPILGVFYLLAKSFFMYWVIMWIKYTFPRIRIDHMLSLCWKFFTPLALVVLMATAVLDKVLIQLGASTTGYTLGMIALNLALGWGVLLVVRRYAHAERVQAEARRAVFAPLADGPARPPAIRTQ
jgi:NADH-quinone oxidoreductase subunit H